ncbi:MAG: hypothetical protein BZ151_08775 [Desulfobacca sp. 4484_104]|nr:MAG: hypothetical protein BZ151_08775 [Desulfobacca sp. 4484_104]
MAIAQEARNAAVNNIDETSHRHQGKLSWLWVMAYALVVFFMIHAPRSGEAFKELIDERKSSRYRSAFPSIILTPVIDYP